MNKLLLDLDAIKQRLPHREPFILVDAVTAYEPQKAVDATRHFAADDLFFQGHFPGNPILPGVLVCEAIAQTGALLVALDRDLMHDQATYLFMGLEHARFFQPVRPGDTLTLHIEKKAEKLNVFKFHGEARVKDVPCARADFSAKLVLNNQMKFDL